MIKINRLECPISLNKKPEQLLQNDYSKQDVKDKLLNMQNGKCCYCERNISDLPDTERQIDHYLPKAYFKDEYGFINWGRANNWLNLLYSCPKCNNTKRHIVPFNPSTNEIIIINPSDPNLDPEEHITFFIDYPIINYKNKNRSTIGQKTIDNLKLLSRTDLHSEFRTRKIEIDKHFKDLINDLIKGIKVNIEQNISELKKLSSANISFAAFNRFYIMHRWNEFVTNDLEKLKSKYQIKIDIRTDIRLCSGTEIIN